MSGYNSYLNELVNQNKKQFSGFCELNWLNPYKAEEFQKKRDRLISALSENLLFKETKAYYQQVSKGCALCGLGLWSCLFITGKCNASCFYCPAPQITDDPPTSQNLIFDTADAYAEYINYFKFKGVSFSGGEPLIYFERVLDYLKKIRKKCQPEIYTWLYTNGILADGNKMHKLGNAGLNEIRFDIGATNYSLDKVKTAKGFIPNVTVEIPAIPEEKDRIIALLPELIKSGVTNLNLHQLRLTKHNIFKLLKRNYTIIPAEQPIVLESELAALEIINYAKKHKLDIGINYCSFFFKYRFQKAGFRKQIANSLCGIDEKITEKGFIREYSSNRIAYKTWLVTNGRNNENSDELKLKYKSYKISKVSVMNETDLNDISGKDVSCIIKMEPEEIPDDPFLFRIWQMEYIEKGLRNY